MTSRDLQRGDEGTDLEVPPPVIFNTYKHHAGAVRARIARLAAEGEAGLGGVAAAVAVLGTGLMDLYTGPLTPRAVCAWVVEELHRLGRLEPAAYRAWLVAGGEYTTVTHPEGTAWVLRLGDEEGRHVHLHPGRHTPHTVRVRANVLKTAFAAHVHARVRGEDPMGRRLLDEVRREVLGLPPLGRDPHGAEGIGAVVGLLR